MRGIFMISSRKSKKDRIDISHIDVRGLLEDLGIDYTEAGKNVSDGWVGVSCPWCGDSSNHLGVNIRSKVCSCFRCGATGNIISYLSEELGSIKNAMDVISTSIPRELQREEEQSVHRPKTVILPKEASEKITPRHAWYLQSRNFHYMEIMRKYPLYFCGPIGKWANRIIVPVYKNFKLITFSSVDISEKSMVRYKHEQEERSILPIKEYLYGIEYTNGHSCAAVEGLFDSWRIGYGAVPTWGTKVTPAQKALLAKFKEVYIAFDGDYAGRKGAEKLGNDLAPFTSVHILDIPEGKDPDTLDDDEIIEIRKLIGMA